MKKIKATTKKEDSSIESKRAQAFRDGLTRVGITARPIKGENTQAMQWNRWTP